MTKVAIYSRCSTSSQSYQRQTEELTQYAQSNKYEIVGQYEEQISGYKKNSESNVEKMMSEVENYKANFNLQS